MKSWLISTYLISRVFFESGYVGIRPNLIIPTERKSFMARLDVDILAQNSELALIYPKFSCLDALGIGGWNPSPIPSGICYTAAPPPTMSSQAAPYWAEIALPTPPTLSLSLARSSTQGGAAAPAEKDGRGCSATPD